MANANLTLLTTANTFGQWVTLTNNMANLYNQLLNGTFVGDNGNVVLPNGSIVLSNGSGTRLSVSGNVTVSQQITSNTIQNLGDLTSQGNNVIFSGPTNLVQVANTVRSNNIIVNANATLGNVTANGFLNFGGQVLKFAMPNSLENVMVTFANNMFISANGNVYTNGAIVTGNANAAHSLAGNVSIGVSLTVPTITTNNVSAGNVNITGAATVGTTLTVTNNVTVGNAVTVTNNVSIGGSATVTNNVTANNITTGNLTVSKNASVGASLTVSNNATVANVITTQNATSTHTLAGNVTIGNWVNAAIANVTSIATNNVAAGNIAITGLLLADDLVLDTLGSYSIIQGNAVFNNVTVQGTQTIQGSIINSSSASQLRSGSGTDGDGSWQVYRGPTFGGNASLTFAHTAGVWRATANDLNGTLLSTILLQSNVVDSFLSTSLNPASANAVNAAYSGAIANAKLSVANAGVFVVQRAGINFIADTPNLTWNVAANAANTTLTDVHLNFQGVANNLSTQANITTVIQDSGAAKGTQVFGVTNGLAGGFPANTGNMIRTYTLGINELMMEWPATATANGNLFFRSLTSANVGDGFSSWSPWQTVITDALFASFAAPTAANALAAYAQANTAYAQANSAYAQANLAYIQANNAYANDNTTAVRVTTAFNQANAAYAQANLAFGQANTANLVAQSAYTQANSAYAQANLVYGSSNTVYGIANAAANTVQVFANGNVVLSQTNLNFNNGAGVNVAVTANGLIQTNITFTVNTALTNVIGGLAYTQANSAYGQANLAYTQANTASANDVATALRVTTAFNQANAAYAQANLAYTQANTSNLTAGTNLTKSGNTMSLATSISLSGTVTALSYNATSDAKMKNNITLIADTSKIVEGINPYTFTWKSDGTISAGVLAQEVLAVFPEAVQRDVLGNLSVNYNALIGILFGEIKDLRRRVAELEVR